MAFDTLRAVLNHVPAKVLKKGDTIFTEGQDSNGVMYFILSGAVVVSKMLGEPPKETIIRILGPTEFFGELALIGDPHRKANVRVATDSIKLAVINQNVFQHLGHVSPPFLSLLLKKGIFRLTEVEKVLSRKKLEHKALAEKIRERDLAKMIGTKQNSPNEEDEAPVDIHAKAMEEVARLSQEPVNAYMALEVLGSEPNPEQ